MPSYPRRELEEMMQRWLDINQRCEAELNWSPMAEMYTDDATYGWNVGPTDEFMAVGKDQIRELLRLHRRGFKRQRMLLQTTTHVAEHPVRRLFRLS